MSFLTVVINGASPGPDMMIGSWMVTRRAVGSNDGHGRLVAGAATTFLMAGSMQPVADGRKLELLAEAAGGREIRLVLTEDIIDPATPDHAADTLTAGGDTWEVIRAEHWTDDGQHYARAYVARVSIP